MHIPYFHYAVLISVLLLVLAFISMNLLIKIRV